jgi:hypothetical protein
MDDTESQFLKADPKATRLSRQGRASHSGSRRMSEAPCASAQGIFTASAKPAEAHPTTLLRSFEGHPFRIHPPPSGRGILRRRVNMVQNGYARRKINTLTFVQFSCMFIIIEHKYKLNFVGHPYEKKGRKSASRTCPGGT